MIVCEVKAMPPQEFKVDLDEGTFEGYCAAYGNVDQGGDRLLPGSGKHIEEANPTVAIFYGHGWMQNERPVGKSLGFKDCTEGMFTKGKVFDVSSNADILVGMREGIIGCMSIGWRPVEKRMVRENGQNIREISKWDIQEYSVLANGFAMNPQALVTAVKAGRVVISTLEEAALEIAGGQIDLTDSQIPAKDYRELREFVEQADPIALLLDEATYLNVLTRELKAEGREDDVRKALQELDSAALVLRGLCAVKEIELEEGDILALIRQTTQKMHEASKELSS